MPLPSLDALSPLPDAAVLVELAVGQRLSTRVTGFLVGKLWITPKDGRPAHWVTALRLYVPEADKPTVPGYWDVTSKKLATALYPYLESGAFNGKLFTFTKVSAPPVGDYTMRVEPAAV